MTEYLNPVLDTRKSFNNKATVTEEGGRITLTSYTTDVAYIEDGVVHINGLYSATTMRHIKEFLYQNGFGVHSKSELIKNFM